MASRKKANSSKSKKQAEANNKSRQKSFMGAEIGVIVLFLISLLLFLSNFGIIGSVGDFLSKIQLDFFGVLGYVFPLILFVTITFCLSNADNHKIWLVAVAVVFILISLCTIFSAFVEGSGGTLGDAIAGLLGELVGKPGTILIMLAVLIISIVFITGKSFVSAVRTRGRKAYDYAKEDASIRRLEHTAKRAERQQARKASALKKVSGIDFAATDLSRYENGVDAGASGVDGANGGEGAGMNGVNAAGNESGKIYGNGLGEDFREPDDFSTTEDKIRDSKASDPNTFVGRIVKPEEYEDETVPFDEENDVQLAPIPQFGTPAYAETADYGLETDAGKTTGVAGEAGHSVRKAEPVVTATGKVIETEESLVQRRIDEANAAKQQEAEKEKIRKKVHRLKPYKIPPMNLLTKGTKSTGSSDNEYKQTAIKLQQTLSTFGINVTVTDISCGPTVTRYELHPELGVKVANILALQDDIKLALAAANIRIEAPIPGKAAIGIEVPNKENNIVQLRDILESGEYKNSKAKIAFAIGKDISGSTMVADLAKMPHLLIAGATGSGKSVCINTLILSILYKYSPQDVKMIMIDPKMVELSGYNGIPHLLIPVVTDVKKAAGALSWAVTEMENRYKKFESIGAKDIASYNEHIEAARESLIAEGHDVDELPEKLPTIVIIVDELADMMMQCKSEVEPAIVRISQLARAAGMHLVIATQRPSVNVITGLIKANIPSRIALSVTSGVDSRTIIDTVGADKLLGHGDMLYSPQDAPKPIRAQGAYVSEKDIHNVVTYILGENIVPDYDDTTFSKMMTGTAAASGESEGRDELFEQIGYFIIDKQKASIGNLQRAFRIGFNRAGRIMDQLANAGVVGPEQGTKPREVLMTREEFEQLCEK